MLVTIHSSRPIGGSITAPPSKSMAHRAVLCAALATGSSHITHLEFSKDISATLAAAGQLCARVTTGPADAVVEGLGRFAPLTAPVDCCESGSTLRFLIPIASLTGQAVTFTGQTSGKWISVKTRTGVQGYCSSLYLTQKGGSYNPGGSSQGNKYYCGRGGKQITYGNAYCPNCGARIDYSGGSCLPNAELTVGGQYSPNYKTWLYSSPSTSSTQILDLYPGDRVMVRSYTPGSSWAYVQVLRSDISYNVGYVLVDAIK